METETSYVNNELLVTSENDNLHRHNSSCNNNSVYTRSNMDNGTSEKSETIPGIKENLHPEMCRTKLSAIFEGNEEMLLYYLDLKAASAMAMQNGGFCVCDPRDEQMKERLQQMQWTPRVILKPINKFGYVEEEVYGFSSKQTALSEGIRSSDTDMAQESKVAKKQEVEDSFLCGVDGCSQRFTSVVSYESHYHTRHSFVCSVCKRTFVSNFLLDVHLEENHDSYFQILSPKIDMYRCLVEDCEQKFRTPELRKDHLVCDHKYPASFSFHRPIKQKPPKHNSPKKHPCPSGSSLPETSGMDVDVGAQDMGSGHQEPKISQGKGNRGQRGRGKNRAPTTICFGRGSQRAFQHKGGRGRHWHQMKKMDVDTTVDIEKVDFGDMVDSLTECGS